MSIGDGSCLIHSILSQICPIYNNIPEDYQKMNYVRNLRSKIAKEIPRSLFDKLGNGSLKEVVSYEDWINIIDSKEPLGEECIEVFTHYFKINISIYWKNMERYPLNLQFYPEYQDVHIYWSGNHYDSIEW